MNENLEQNVKKSRPILCTVSSAKMDKSRVATVDRKVKDIRYKRYIKRQTRLMFHDPKNETKEGDVVLITPSKPRSARKKFDLLKIVKQS